MKTLFRTLLPLATALALASCQSEQNAVPGDGTPVDATLSVVLGPQARAFADGTTVDRLYAGIYEIRSAGEYVLVAENSASPAGISDKTGTVSFPAKILRGVSYRIVLWAQKEGAPYTIDWASTATTGPTVTATPSGPANAENRDAFYGVYDTGVVLDDIDLTDNPVQLNRPLAQVNILVPTDNFDTPVDKISSSMTVVQAPTVLNLATGAASSPANWTFTKAGISERAFGDYANTHRYAAMNYVLVDQSGNGADYTVCFSVESGPLSALDMEVPNVPLKPNSRTNLVGNIFIDNKFDLTLSITVSPGFGSDMALVRDFTTIAGLKMLLDGTEKQYTGVLTNAVVTFVPTADYAVIKDGTASILYHKEGGHGLKQGQNVSGNLTVNALILDKGYTLLTDLSAKATGSGGVIEPENVSLSQLTDHFAKYEDAYVKLTGVTSEVTASSKGTFTVTQDGISYIIRTDADIELHRGDVLDLRGTVTKENGVEMLKVWNPDDLEIVIPVPFLSATPSQKRVNAEVTSVTWKIHSSVDWTISTSYGLSADISSGHGDKEITLSFPSNDRATVVTYTAKVSAAGCSDVNYTITQRKKGNPCFEDSITAAALRTVQYTNYSFTFRDFRLNSPALYAGLVTCDASRFYFDNGEGMVSTKSGGRVKSVTIVFAPGNTGLHSVFAKNKAYTDFTNLTNDRRGTLIKSVSESYTIEFPDDIDYPYVGIRADNTHKTLLNSIVIRWEEL